MTVTRGRVGAAVVALCGLWGVGQGEEPAAASAPPAAAPSEVQEAAPARLASALKDIKFGPGSFDIGLSLRMRYEFLNNFDAKGFDTGEGEHLLLERLRLDVGYRIDPGFLAFIQVQDSHFWLSKFDEDDFVPSCSHQDPIDLRQAFVEWGHIGGTPFGFKVGRQLLQYGDERVLGPGEWSNVGRWTWDAVKAMLDLEWVNLDGFFARRLEYDPHHFDDGYFDFRLVGAYAQWQKLPFDLHTFWLYKYDEKGTVKDEGGASGDERRHTAGASLEGECLEGMDYKGLFAFQFGGFGRDDIRAYGFNVGTGYTLDCAWKPRVGAAFTYASGDSGPTDGRNETFDGAFGAVAKYYGRMNLFSWQNLEDYEVGLSAKPVKGLKVSLDYHFFRLAEAEDAWYWCNGKPQRRDPTGASGQSLGHELDLVASYQVAPGVALTAGYGHFFPVGFIAQTGSGGNADWVFLQFELAI